jgi:pyridoxamine 5'-phosphate oxidase
MEKHAFVTIDGFDYTLAQLEDNLWRRLLNGAVHPKDAFHTGALATIGPDGPAVRTVVLRQVLPEAKVLICHTDRRSDKVRDIQHDPRISWHFYDPAARLQLRLQGTAELLTTGPEVDQAWANTHAEARKCYCSLAGPGAPLPYPGTGLESDWDYPGGDAGREQFCVVRSQVTQAEWLWLNRAGHRRARFGYGGGATWIVP